jgi:DNA-binding CsgD family transcriptional regulator
VIGGGLEHQLAALRPLLDAVGARAGGLAVVDGDPGTGRTSMIDHIAVLARRAELRVAIARVAPHDAEIPFGVVGSLGDELEAKVSTLGYDTAEDVAEVAARLLEAAGSRDDAPGTCLLVDDAQWTDEASLRALLHASRRLRDRPVALVLAAGPDTASPQVAGLLDELRASPGAVLLRLHPLGPEDARALVGAALGPDADPAMHECLLDRTGGNPFLLTALLDHLATSGDADDLAALASAVPDRVRAHVATRLSRLGRDAVALGRAVAVLGDEATLPRASRLAELDRRAAEDAADDLVRNGLLGPGAPLAFRQSLVGDAVHTTLERFTAERLHREAAKLLVADDQPPRVAVPHLLRTTPTGEAWVVDQLRRAADEVTQAGDCAAAATLLRRALDEPPADETRSAVLSELAFAASRAGLPDAEARLADAVAAVTTQDERLMLLRERTRLLWLTGRLPEAVEASETALAESDPGTELYEQLLAELLAVASMHDLAPIYSRPRLVALLDRANTGWVPDSAALAATLATVLPFVVGDLRLVGPLVDRAVQEDIWRLEAPPFGMRPDFVIGSLWLSDGLERGTRIVRQGMATVDPENLFRHGLLHYWLGEIRYAAGDLPGAIAAAAAALEERWGPFLSWFGFSSATLAHAYMDLDDDGRAEQILGTTDERVDPHQLYGIAVDLARARLALRHDRPAESAALVALVDERIGVLGHRDSPQIVWRPVAAAARHAVGDTDRALALIDEDIEIARRTHALGRLGRALRTKATIVDPAERLVVLQEAVDVLRGSERALERARALLALGVELHDGGDVTGARSALTEAREEAESCGAPSVANRALHALHATGARPRRTARTGLDSLTGAERRAVELAAAGRTNREIGAELMITAKTVEWHLGRAFAKLGVRSRRDLEGVLARRTDQ